MGATTLGVVTIMEDIIIADIPIGDITGTDIMVLAIVTGGLDPSNRSIRT